MPTELTEVAECKVGKGAVSQFSIVFAYVTFGLGWLSCCFQSFMVIPFVLQSVYDSQDTSRNDSKAAMRTL
jgi:hypothetical protein